MEADRTYWTSVQDGGHGLGKEDLEHAIAKLRYYSRAFQAVNVINLGFYADYGFDPELLMATLEDGLKPRDELTGQNLGYVGHSIRRLFERLQATQGVDPRRLASLEWAYLPLFQSIGLTPTALHGWLREDPNFFAEVISLVYRPRNETKPSDDEPSDEVQARARTGFSLLRSFRTVPGQTEGGGVESATLLAWVRRARELCEATGRLEACDDTIGQVLAHSPEEADGGWPCVAVREVLEEVDTEAIADGFHAGIINKRGVVSKSPTEGGLQEKALAEKYEKHARACDFAWPVMAKILRRAAKAYESAAKREDDRLELEH